ncbi:MAG: TatD family hydrolase [Idiomarinaceae bacterium HL-53]|nr:MAG: TatD family hydrolase [Idiomarinaceae bacterium HL-53]CUS48951.1 TatD DNase family protein [Idiomarinaceae bacterium HL-53]
MKFVDSHCHLDKIKQETTTVLARAAQNGIEHVLCIGVTLEDYPVMREKVGPLEGVSFSCGVHPLYMKEGRLEPSRLREYAQDSRVVAIGETGLDYYYDKEYHAKQQESFTQHIELACELKKPLVIHTRDARADTISMLREGHAERCSGVLHCFTESLEMAKQALELGFYISISGIATFRNAEELRDVIRALPLDRLLIETDSPWLAPVPHRGQENEPAYVSEVANCVAKVKGVSLETVAQKTCENFYQLFTGASQNGVLIGSR